MCVVALLYLHSGCVDESLQSKVGGLWGMHLVLLLFGQHVIIVELGRLFEFVLLCCVLFPLSVAATAAFGGRTLVSKCRPWSKILASLAPFNLDSIGRHDDPHSHITRRTEPLVLTRNDVSRTIVGRGGGRGHLGAMASTRQAGRRAQSQLPTHDTILLAVQTLTTTIGSTGSDEIVREVHQAVEIGEGYIFGLFSIPVQNRQQAMVSHRQGPVSRALSEEQSCHN